MKRLQMAMLCAASVLGLPSLLLPSLAAAEAVPARPNIVWIVGDDLGPQLGAYGDTRAHTPTLDRLAARGVRFDHAFAASPTCSPSRSALITGRYPTELGTQHHRSKLLQPPRTLLDDLQAAGYTIAWFGFALASGPIASALGFRGVLLFAAGCQLVSYVAIRFWVREGR